MSQLTWLCLSALWVAACSEAPVPASPVIPETAGPSPAQLEAGRRLFREGIGTNGDPVQATVLGDVAITAAQANCQNCHGRSGMGTAERGQRTPAITGPLLYAEDFLKTRPAYDRASLLRAITAGVGADGQPLDRLMPRYALSPVDADALLAHLDTLGGPQPGVDREGVHFATVLSASVSDSEKEAVTDVLKAWVDLKNAQTRNDRARSEARRQDGRAYTPTRDWHLHVWTVEGPAETWADQLVRAAEQQPIFAVVGGAVAGSFAPVHSWCEATETPCLFPSTDQVPELGEDHYTVYLSGGMRTEAAVLARELGASDEPVAQLADPSDPRAVEAAAALAGLLGDRLVVNETTDSHGAFDRFMGARVAWTGCADLPDSNTGRQFASATLCPPGTPRSAGVPATITVDRRLRPGERDAALLRFRAWANGRKLPVSVHEDLQAETWFAAMAFLDGMKHIHRYPDQDWLLDSLDHAAGLTIYVPRYPRPTFGPGQRIVSKGAGVVDLDGAVRWVVP